MRRWVQVVIWCVGIAAIILVTLYAELASRPQTPIIVTFSTTESETATTEASTTSTMPLHTTYASVASTPTAIETTTTMTTAICRDLNAATAADLQRVNGIGAVLAEAILSERTRLGGFCSRAQLLEIPGIGTVLTERIMAEFEIPNELPQTVATSAVTTTTCPTTTSLLTTQLTTESTTASTTREAAGYYNINVVTREELLLIEGVDEQMADDILALRELIQYFSNLAELMYIDGMDGGFVLRVLQKHLYVGERETTASTMSNTSILSTE